MCRKSVYPFLAFITLTGMVCTPIGFEPQALADRFNLQVEIDQRIHSIYEEKTFLKQKKQLIRLKDFLDQSMFENMDLLTAETDQNREILADYLSSFRPLFEYVEKKKNTDKKTCKETETWIHFRYGGGSGYDGKIPNSAKEALKVLAWICKKT